MAATLQNHGCNMSKPMATRRRMLLKVIILGDSGYRD
jgi:hypothetical protein